MTAAPGPETAVWRYHSAVPGISWPGLPTAAAANRLAIQFQFEHAQWLPPQRVRELQFRQLAPLLRHAYETVPYYRALWRNLYDPDAALTPELFRRLPIFDRSQLQLHAAELASTRVPASHGPVSEARTSGSTGQPVSVLKTALTELLWQSVLLREHHWFARDLSGTLATIRQGVRDGVAQGWGPATDEVAASGRAAALSVRADVEAQLAWLQQLQPAYLLTYPSNVAELARSSLARGIRIASLREVRTFGELLASDTRELCRQAWGVPITDSYSTTEAGYIALQCPRHEQYHVQSETVLAEVLDDHGEPCAPGGVGRVIVTVLHNFAMPIVRYDIGDYAEVAEPCSCGRGLPVLRRIIGRVRNMLVTADGRRYWPGLGTHAIAEIAAVRQYQLVQKTYDRVECRLVAASALTQQQEDRLRHLMLSRLPSGLRLDFVYCDSIPRSAGGKFEDFICEVAAPRA